MKVLEKFVLAGVLGFALGRPLDEDPSNRCQGKKRGEVPHGFTKETYNEKETECIYFCQPPSFRGQWFFGIIEDNTHCKSPSGEPGYCKSGVCTVDEAVAPPNNGTVENLPRRPDTGGLPTPGSNDEGEERPEESTGPNDGAPEPSQPPTSEVSSTEKPPPPLDEEPTEKPTEEEAPSSGGPTGNTETSTSGDGEETD